MKPTFYHRTYEFTDGLKLELGVRTLVMGILNATPDSFSDGGRYDEVSAAVERAKQMADDGADIIDVGGESTRPGYAPVSEEEEIRRVVPVIRAIREHVALPISIDTYKAETARAALEAGAHIVNDVWGFKREPELAAVSARFGCPVVLTHNRNDHEYSDFIPDLLRDLQECVAIARNAGVEERNVWLDPGIGFAKDLGQNLDAMGRLGDIVALGYPVLLGTSRKSFIQRTLGVTPGEALEGTAATTALGIAQGCQIVRVHDVAEMKRVAAMTDAIAYRQAGTGV
ncbi:dihydropteroate synthase [Cohnella suwonensis]|uniref:Dihydropteroate synthase n=1 Tax=Cohnella suwonensis TaxID=696072 RepID=A0ABW0LRK8_9BACL